MKEKYEISLWEDYLEDATDTHYNERRLCIIGSNTLTSGCRAYEPTLTENINGTNSFSFKMYFTYREGLEILPNPFLDYLINERKVKVFWKNKWYDFLIKDIQEDSEDKSITYTCEDLFVNELSKNGYNIQLTDDLYNNQGTILDLAEKVLEDSDWQLDRDGSSIIRQEKEEPVYEVTSLGAFYAKNQTKNIGSEQIPANKTFLVFYEQLQDFIKDTTKTSEAKTIQFAYASKYETDVNSQKVVNADCYEKSITLVKVAAAGTAPAYIKILGNNSFHVGDIYYESGVSRNYRASRLVTQQWSELDSLTDEYCNVWIAQEDGTGEYADLISKDDEIYEIKETEFIEGTSINNIIVNANNFVDTSGWEWGVVDGHQTGTDYDLMTYLFPEFGEKSTPSGYNATSLMRAQVGGAVGAIRVLYNAALQEQTNFLSEEGIVIGEEFVVRVKLRKPNEKIPGQPDTLYYGNNEVLFSQFHPGIYEYITSETDGSKTIDISKPLAEFIPFDNGDSPGDYWRNDDTTTDEPWLYVNMRARKSISIEELLEGKMGLFFRVYNFTAWIEDIQLFKRRLDDGNGRFNPGDIDTRVVQNNHYSYYNKTKTRSEKIEDANDIKYLYKGTTPWNYTTNPSKLLPKMNENFSKIRSIEAKESNRFNILQTLAETFDCWARFTINHDADGKISYNSDGTPQKYVSFVTEVGQETGIGFIYGIDLQSISRSIQSDQIVTKTIVKPNNNEFAKNGQCGIANSTENFPKVDYILNFDYFINKGMIDEGVLNADLYDRSAIGYYDYLNEYNGKLLEIGETLAELKKQRTIIKNTKDMAYAAKEEASTDRTTARQNLIALANGASYDDDKTKGYILTNKDSLEVQEYLYKETTAKKLNEYYSNQYTTAASALENYENQIKQKEAERQTYIDLQKQKDKEFYSKYSRFIHEGTWSSEDYIDANLYYLDAQSVAYTSARPQISYDISVFRISSLDEYKNKVFYLGDIAFVQDTEFFGYKEVASSEGIIKTPYREKVIISEIASHFDSPEKDSFIVQNYRTQFEDLFQRITATTQSLQYAAGQYARAASAVTTEGLVSPEVLQQSLQQTGALAYSSTNAKVTQDSTGLTCRDGNKMVKISPLGIFISRDGGSSWTNALSATGIATEALSAGIINSNSINIMDGQHSTFRWDSSGINAYSPIVGGGLSLSQFVRFDHFGIYGINNNTGDSYKPQTEQEVWDDARFGMTWRGFFIKNAYDTHRVEISSTNDIQVVATPQGGAEITRVKIGNLGSGNFGLRINDANQNPILETNSDGSLWLKKELNISSTPKETNPYSIKLGYLEGGKRVEGKFIHEVFNANGEFKVYEDGSMAATSGTFEGEIIATSGRIGSMTVTDNGLTVQGGFFKILDANEDTLLSYENDENGLVIAGNSKFKGIVYATAGEFTGTVHATAGEFTGTVKAQNIFSVYGEIGSFVLRNEGLFSVAGAEVDETGLYTIDNSYIQLNGEKGTIKATEIALDVANLNKRIQLGSRTTIWNPDDDRKENNNVGRILQISRPSSSESTKSLPFITLYDTGLLELGDLTLDGATSTITTTKKDDNGFEITPGHARFYNIEATGKISTVVFEANHVQAVGGTMMFKSSYKVSSQEIMTPSDDENTSAPNLNLSDDENTPIPNLKLVLEEEYKGSVGNYVFLTLDQEDTQGVNLVQGTNIITEVDDDKKTLYISSTGLIGGNDKIIGLIDIGKEGSVIIGVNSNDAEVSFLRQRGITVSEFSPELEGHWSNPKIFIGDLDEAGIDWPEGRKISGGRGYGLYGENVYLTGSLTNAIASTIPNELYTYAGINTLNGATATIFGTSKGADDTEVYDNSKIIFWGGAKNLYDEAIQGAPFQVTEQGSLYASKAFIKGSIITESEIRAPKIYTAEIHGAGIDSSKPGLSFYEIENGIGFFKKEQVANSTEVFSLLFQIGSSGLCDNQGNPFISITNSSSLVKPEAFSIYTTAYLDELTAYKISTSAAAVDQSYLLNLIGGDIVGYSKDEDKMGTIRFSYFTNGTGQKKGEIGFYSETQTGAIESESKLEMAVSHNLVEVQSDILRASNKFQLHSTLLYEIHKIKEEGIDVIDGYDLYVN